MEEDGGGGGNDGGGLGYMNVPITTPNLVHMTSSPILTEINRFLLEEENISSHQKQAIPTINNTNCYNSSEVCEFSSSFPLINTSATNEPFAPPGLLSNSSGSSDIGIGYIEDFPDEDVQRWTKELERTLELPSKEERGFIRRTNPKNKGQKVEKEFIKGQWTEEEDRKLIMLVIKYGERWAEIAEEMVGRAGKQCRERWHNHLRPNLKKSLWTEEEDIQLIEAHKIVGNKWAEIAKRIPGRSENSVKNYWNATKRKLMAKRQNVKRNRKNDKQSNLLEEYIKTQITTDCNDKNNNSSSTAINDASTANPDTPPTPEVTDELLASLKEIFPDLYPIPIDSVDLLNPTCENGDDQFNSNNPINGNGNSSSLSHDHANLEIGVSTNNLPNEETQLNYPGSNDCFSYSLGGNGNVISTSNTNTTPFSVGVSNYLPSANNGVSNYFPSASNPTPFSVEVSDYLPNNGVEQIEPYSNLGSNYLMEGNGNVNVSGINATPSPIVVSNNLPNVGAQQNYPYSNICFSSSFEGNNNVRSAIVTPFLDGLRNNLPGEDAQKMNYPNPNLSFSFNNLLAGNGGNGANGGSGNVTTTSFPFPSSGYMINFGMKDNQEGSSSHWEDMEMIRVHFPYYNM